MTRRSQLERLGLHLARSARSVRATRLEVEALKIDIGIAEDLYKVEIALKHMAADLQRRQPVYRRLDAYLNV